MARDLAYIDRDGMPKNPGDRLEGHGDSPTYELVEGSEGAVNYESSVSAGEFVNFDGEGGIYRPSTVDNADDPLEYDAIVQHDAELGDHIAVHQRGEVRAAEKPGHGDADHPVWPTTRRADPDGADDPVVLIR